MLVVLAFHPGDADQALLLADWIAEIGGCNGHEILLIVDKAVEQERVVAIVGEFQASFNAVKILEFVDHNHGRKWQDGGSAAAANDMFSTAAKHIANTLNRPWLWLEPDCVPLKAGWLQEIANEYARATVGGKWFLGDLVTPQSSGKDVVTHCSGIAVYPANMYDHAGEALIAGDLAWDVAAADQIVPQMAVSELIVHAWRHPEFTTWADVQRDIFDKKPGAALFHADKSGSLIPLIREHNLPQQQPDDGPRLTKRDDGSDLDRRTQDDGPMTTGHAGGSNIVCDIFIKTYPPDYPWLEYCLRSIDKFASGFGTVTIVDPRKPSDKPYFPATNTPLGSPGPLTMVLQNPEYGENGYLSQQVFKLYADEFTDADCICYVDSDTIFTTSVSPEMFFTNGKLNWLCTPYADIETPWKVGSEQFLGLPIEFEFMRRFPIVVPRWILAEVRAFCLAKHNVELSDYVMAQTDMPFSEFNILGAYAYQFHRDKFNWIDTSRTPESEWPPLVVRQAYSHDGITEAIRAEFEAILSSKPEMVLESVTHSDHLLSHDELEASQITPWADFDESVAEINRIGKRLRDFQTWPGAKTGEKSSRVRFVRELLQKQGVIVLPYRNKKRRGWKKKRAKK